MLNRILMIGLVAGGLSGFAASAVQAVWPAPLILEAETYENRGPAASAVVATGPAVVASHDHSAHLKAAEPWAPEDGLERTLWTLVINVIIGVGGAFLLVAGMNLLPRVTIGTGLGWGAAGFATFALAPALGLPPELPGTFAVELAERQGWWLGTVVATAFGLGLMFYGKASSLRVLGAALLAVPHIIGAPQPDVHGGLAPAELQHQFVVAALLSSAVFWLVLGGVSGFMFQRFERARQAAA